MRKSDAYKDRIRELLRGLPDDDWLSGGQIARAVAMTDRDHNSIAGIISVMRHSGELLREGLPPRGCRYRLNPNYVPEDRDPNIGPASAYEGPAVGDANLCPSVGTPIEAFRLPEAA
jgi:hypothetical protein